MTFLRIVIPLYLFDLSMIFSENRYPLFRIMLYSAAIPGIFGPNRREMARAPVADRGDGGNERGHVAYRISRE
jgi:hypothetical protein